MSYSSMQWRMMNFNTNSTNKIQTIEHSDHGGDGELESPKQRKLVLLYYTSRGSLCCIIQFYEMLLFPMRINTNRAFLFYIAKLQAPLILRCSRPPKKQICTLVYWFEFVFPFMTSTCLQLVSVSFDSSSPLLFSPLSPSLPVSHPFCSPELFRSKNMCRMFGEGGVRLVR